ncbi:hypothetical protein [Nocardioides stalactiti]|uniref:hypothetical protein n=1 Tax=Nocardioides stalactiti TaxID=2755356 RepID=UPI0015FFE8FC|nr:hypothetical protein [Nocardioides stalactiti]
MGWKDVAKMASQWADAKKTELLTADRRTREDASASADAVERNAQGEAVTSFLEATLPPSLAARVTAARPENMAARQAAEDAREAEERRERLEEMAAGGATAELTLTISGGEQGTVTVTLPCERREEHPEPEDDGYGGPPPLGWFFVRVESPTLVPVGSTALSELSLAVPDFRGPGRYDLAALAARSDAGDLASWDALEMYLNPTGEADDRIFYVDTYGERPVLDVTPTSLTFDLPMASAVSSIRVTGTITWA